MWKLMLICIGTCATIEGTLVELDSFNQDTFVKLFRQVLLQKVAVEWNVTIEQSNVLKTKNIECNGKIDAQVNACKSETQSACGYDAFSELKDGLNKVGSVLLSAGSTVLGGLGTVGTGIKDGLTQVGDGVKGAVSTVTNAISSVGQSIGSALGHIFGKKREIDAETRRCMEKCTSCHALLLDNEHMLRSVCGDQVVDLDRTVKTRAQQIGGIYNATIDAIHPIISKVEYDPATMNNMKFTTVFVTAYLRGSYVRYQSSVAYAMMDIPGTVRNMAMEYWNKMA
ncbi:hypothetical protein ACJMK2_021759 [Sinanodonta woodiana]|uniref:Uncharacterized protein n=1 Tax=Sinanodonta woodiana TaxID=1069815 RepID=A0ABD3TI02_SINWO